MLYTEVIKLWWTKKYEFLASIWPLKSGIFVRLAKVVICSGSQEFMLQNAWQSPKTQWSMSQN